MKVREGVSAKTYMDAREPDFCDAQRLEFAAAVGGRHCDELDRLILRRLPVFVFVFVNCSRRPHSSETT